MNGPRWACASDTERLAGSSRRRLVLLLVLLIVIAGAVGFVVQRVQESRAHKGPKPLVIRLYGVKGGGALSMVVQGPGGPDYPDWWIEADPGPEKWPHERLALCATGKDGARIELMSVKYGRPQSDASGLRLLIRTSLWLDLDLPDFGKCVLLEKKTGDLVELPSVIGPGTYDLTTVKKRPESDSVTLPSP